MPVVVLLGAGASADAGVPTTADITERMVREISENYRALDSGAAAALNFVVGAMIAHDSAAGASPFEGLNIERVFTAVELLATRDDLEVTPFVASWNPAVDSAGGDGVIFPPGFDRALRNAFVTDFPNRILEVFTTGVRSITSSRSSSVFAQLGEEMTFNLRQLLHIARAEDTAYLRPLFEILETQPSLTVATLNYDLAVEKCGSYFALPVETGIRDWIANGRWPTAPPGLRLLKLHGSVDWCLDTEHAADGRLRSTTIGITTDPVNERRAPAIVFGQRGKLRAEGPFLEMFAEFGRALDAANRLLVVGYSFHDEHVNELIRRWINGDVARQLRIIDPSFPEPGPGMSWSTDFRLELLNGLISPKHHPGLPQPSWTSRLGVARSRTADALPSVLAELAGNGTEEEA